MHVCSDVSAPKLSGEYSQIDHVHRIEPSAILSTLALRKTQLNSMELTSEHASTGLYC